MTRREFLQASGLVAIGIALMRPAHALARRAEPEAAPLPPDSAYERMKRLRVDYMLAAGDTQRRLAINQDLVALAFEMKDAGASRADIMTIGQKSLYFARQEVAALRAAG